MSKLAAVTHVVRRSRGIRLFSVFAVAGLLAGGNALAGDNFPGTTITGNGSFVASNSGATSETGEPATFGGGSLNSMWYSWTAPSTGVATVGTCNQTGSTSGNFDTTMGVYTGTALGGLTTIGTNDDTTGCNVTVNSNYGSVVQFNAVAGNTYRFQVDGYASATGNFNLHYGRVGITTNVTDNIAVEGGGGASFTVQLDAIPRTNATVTIGSSSQCTFSPTSLTFTNANWAVPRTVTVTAINDTTVEGIHSCAPATITASGGAYGGVSTTPPTITVYDNEVASFSISKTVDTANIAAPGTLGYVITVVNTSGVNMTGTSLTDVLTQGGSGLTLTSGPTGPSGDGGTAGRLDVGETWTWTATYAVPQSGIDNAGDIVNTATFDTTQTAPFSAAATTTVTAAPSMAVTKTASASGFVTGNIVNAPVGTVVTYTYVVTNTGNQTVTSIALSESHNGSGPPPVPGGEAISTDAAPLSDSFDASASNGVWSSLAPGDSVSFTGTYVITQYDVDNLQ